MGAHRPPLMKRQPRFGACPEPDDVVAGHASSFVTSSAMREHKASGASCLKPVSPGSGNVGESCGLTNCALGFAQEDLRAFAMRNPLLRRCRDAFPPRSSEAQPLTGQTGGLQRAALQDGVPSHSTPPRWLTLPRADSTGLARAARVIICLTGWALLGPAHVKRCKFHERTSASSASSLGWASRRSAGYLVSLGVDSELPVAFLQSSNERNSY
jgi:hypothetical protein